MIQAPITVAEARNTDAQGNEQRLVAARAAQADGRCAQFLGDSGRGLDAAARNEHAEPVPAHARDQSALAAPPRQQLRDGANDFVADVHAVIFVDHAELIDVDIQQSMRAGGGFLTRQSRGGVPNAAQVNRPVTGSKLERMICAALRAKQFQRFGIA
jgi:hypothetical protein